MQHGLSNGQPPSIGRVLERLVQIFKVIALKSDIPRINLADSLLNGFFEGAADSHDFTDGLHRTANVAIDVLELAQIPPGNLGYNVVQTRLKVGGSSLCDCIWQLRKSMTKSNLCSGISKWVSSSFRGKG